ncbi:MAG: hypothetical protein KBH06_01295 [Spirochaetes bacterium]|nr:hypothetical protein [Spirochaetota bacterium]
MKTKTENWEIVDQTNGSLNLLFHRDWKHKTKLEKKDFLNKFIYLFILINAVPFVFLIIDYYQNNFVYIRPELKQLVVLFMIPWFIILLIRFFFPFKPLIWECSDGTIKIKNKTLTIPDLTLIRLKTISRKKNALASSEFYQILEFESKFFKIEIKGKKDILYSKLINYYDKSSLSDALRKVAVSVNISYTDN